MTKVKMGGLVRSPVLTEYEKTFKLHVNKGGHIMKRRLFISAFTAASLAMCASVGAAEYKINKNFSKSTVTIEGKGEKKDSFMLLITPADTDTENLWAVIPDGNKTKPGEYTVADAGKMIGYAGEFKSDENGDFSFETVLTDSGKYNISVFSTAENETKTFSVEFVSKTEYETAIAALNDKINDKDEFYTALAANVEKIGFEAEASKLRDISDILFASLDGKPLDKDEYKDNYEKFEISKLIAALNKSNANISSIDLIETIISKNSKLAATYKKFVTEQSYKEYMISRMSGKGLSKISDLETKLTEAVILTAVKYPNGFMNIKSVFEDYKTDLGIASVSNLQSVYSNLAGNEYEDKSALITAYNSLASDSGSAGGSAGGGSSSSVGRKDNTSSMGIVSTNTSNNETVTMKFDDLDTVSWAYEAISTLSDAGIISGKSETKFAPRDNIKREEFVKLMIGLIGEAPGGENIFTDVGENDWFCGYVAKANELGIVSGIETNIFGTGRNITRQDMAVILYRALEYKGKSLESGELEFSDSGEVAIYAQKAVAALAKAGIINGVGDGRFNPTGLATRAEAAEMVFGVYKLVK